ncbi:retrotransposon protein, putative, ty1-copia subclass [Tanacetum coccineum]
MKHLVYPMPLVLGLNLLLTSLSKDYDQCVQNYNMHSMWKSIPELHAMLKLAKKGLRGIQKLIKGALDLYNGNGNCAAAKAMGSFDLILPSGMVLVLDNCHFAPSITRGVISLSYLWDNGFLYKFMDNGAISVSKDNVFYSYDGIFEIDMHNHLIDDESFDACVSCISRKMARKPFTFASERADALLGIIHSDYVDLLSTNTLEKAEHDDVKPQTDINPFRRSVRIPQAHERYGYYVDAEEHKLEDHGEPTNYRVAFLDPKFDKWLEAMNVEMQSMKDNQVWNLVDLPPNYKIVGSKWLFKKKTDMDANKHTYKARLVAKGFTQTYGVNN